MSTSRNTVRGLKSELCFVVLLECVTERSTPDYHRVLCEV